MNEEVAIPLRKFQEQYRADYPWITTGWLYRRIYDIDRKYQHLQPAFEKVCRTWTVRPGLFFKLLAEGKGGK